MRQAQRALLTIALASTLLAGCSKSDGDHPAGTASDAAATVAAASWGTDPAPATRSARLGASGSPCALPVTFDTAPKWKPASVPDGVATQAGFALRCEIDAKPAGLLGFLRVWVGAAGADPAASLDAFLAGQPGVVGRQTRTAKAGALPAAETTYLTENAELGVRRQERVLAVATGRSTVVFSIGGVSLDEHRGLLPAYVLARQTVAAAA